MSQSRLTHAELTPTDHARADHARAELTLAISAPTDFESRLRFGLSEVLSERPELRQVLPLAAMMDDAVRWCA